MPWIALRPGPGGVCEAGPGGQLALDQRSPCLVCELEDERNCQLWDDADFSLKISDLGAGSGMLRADDFIAGTGTTEISQICTYGSYMTRIIGQTPPDLDCGEDPGVIDNFRARVLANGRDDLPDAGAVIGTSQATSIRGVIPGAASRWGFFELNTYAYQLTLADPIQGLVPGQKYWLEISNNLPAEAQCAWNWAVLSFDSPQGNHYSAAGSDAGGYPLGSAQATDHAWCLDGRVDPPPEIIRPCCRCDGYCFRGSLEECNFQNADYQPAAASWNGVPLECDSQFVCPADGRPVNDDCANAIPIAVGTTTLSTHCSTTDGYNPIPDPMNDWGIGVDVWYSFRPVQNCTLRLDMCATGTTDESFDSALAVYSNGTSGCPCPIDAATHNATFIDAQDETCGAGSPVGGAGRIDVLNASAGVCYMIRIGNWQPGGTRGLGIIDVSCGAPICGDNAAQSINGEECDGLDLSGCPGPGYTCNSPGHPQDCQCAIDECGDNVRSGSEECDGTDDDACPGFCQANCFCLSACGNGVRESVEECDGPADTSCGGAAGRCLNNCTCPPVVCGNGFRDPDEECDPGGSAPGDEDDDLCPGECRLAGDPAGECTCRCGEIIVDNFFMVLPEGVGKPRFISFAVDGPSEPVDTALRVRLASLHHPTNPPPDTPDLTAYEGQYRYVRALPGNVTTCPDSLNFGTSYRCATLGCQPEYRDWRASLGGAPLHVSESAIVPSSTYGVSLLLSSCGPAPAADSCSQATSELIVSTTRWGDVVGPGNGPPDDINNVLDISAVVDKVKDLATAFYEPRMWLKYKDPAGLTDAVNVIDIGFAVDGVKFFPYPASFTVDACP